MNKKDKNLCPNRVYVVMALGYFVVIQTLDSGPRISCLSLGLTQKEIRTEGFGLNNHSLSSERTSLHDVIGVSECLREGYSCYKHPHLKDEELETPRVKPSFQMAHPGLRGRAKGLRGENSGPEAGADFTARPQLDHYEEIHLGPKHIFWPLIL